jgi:hypothetical protein
LAVYVLKQILNKEVHGTAQKEEGERERERERMIAIV